MTLGVISKMRFLDLFAGIGGFRRGMELAGHECVGFCEFDRFAVASYTSMHLITEEQRAYLATLPLQQRQKEILKDEYRNGEWYANDIRDVRGRDLPLAECWGFGAPCQDFSIAGNRAGLDGDRSSLVREVFRLVGEVREEDRPEWLIYENVKGMLSSNRGLDFAFILAELDERGYDAQWSIFNSKDYGVPQNRERVYLIGHSRRKGRCKVFPFEAADRENCFQVEQIGTRRSHRNNRMSYSSEDCCGVAPTLDSMGGGGREPHVSIPISVSGFEVTSENATESGPVSTDDKLGDHKQNTLAFVDLTTKNAEMTENARCLKARYDNGVSNLGGERNRVITDNGLHPALTATDYKQPISVAVPIRENVKRGYSVAGGETRSTSQPQEATQDEDG